MASDIASLLERRQRLLGPNVATFYDEPVHLVKGEGVWLWDADGRKYLDCYNNVPHVGHCHPRVVEAICRQASTLNTHTRYMHELVLDYIEQLTATMNAPLECAVMTCTGSEANDLALRMARAVTGKTGIIATNHTYHGNSMVVSQLSTTSKPVGPAFDNIRLVRAPDSYRPHTDDEAQAFADEVQQGIKDLENAGHGFSALLLCPIFANEGFPAQEPGWLKPVAEVVRKAGGLLIADEIQPGFGRIGSHMWGYQRRRDGGKQGRGRGQRVRRHAPQERSGSVGSAVDLRPRPRRDGAPEARGARRAPPGERRGLRKSAVGGGGTPPPLSSRDRRRRVMGVQLPVTLGSVVAPSVT